VVENAEPEVDQSPEAEPIEAQAEENQEIDSSEQAQNGVEADYKGKRAGPFKRIDERILEGLSEQLKDNSFNAKFMYGRSGDSFGMEGHEKLKDKAGKGFRKEKSKLKNKNFQGGKIGKIGYSVNSTKL
jgi:hypothetical protein